MKILKHIAALAVVAVTCSCQQTDKLPRLATNQVAFTVLSVTPQTVNWTKQHEVALRVDAPDELRGRELTVQPTPYTPSSAIDNGWPPSVGATLVVPPVHTNLMLRGDWAVLKRMYPSLQLDGARVRELLEQRGRLSNTELDLILKKRKAQQAAAQVQSEGAPSD